jgi:hypothetical protein
MPRFNGVVTIGAGAIKTVQELIQEAIEDRTYATAQIQADEISRWYGATPLKGVLQPVDGDIYVVDAYKGVLNGKVTNAKDGVTLIAADFTGDPAADIWAPGQVKDLQSVYLGGQVVYAVAETNIYIDAVCE